MLDALAAHETEYNRRDRAAGEISHEVDPKIGDRVQTHRHDTNRDRWIKGPAGVAAERKLLLGPRTNYFQ